ncbi:exgA [Symbiodinium pilosum]|uniref:ExgA protein n=1 Tax=Symbiodinium pilosum TaxID=2952 RepID=A0A812SVU6_SYMPI|nr:exgA [Symbiodinium pilosum]
MGTFAAALLQTPTRCLHDLRRAQRAYHCKEHDEWEVLADDPNWPGEDAQQLRVLGQVCGHHDVPNVKLVMNLAFRGTVSQENLATNLLAELVPCALGSGSTQFWQICQSLPAKCCFEPLDTASGVHWLCWPASIWRRVAGLKQSAAPGDPLAWEMPTLQLSILQLYRRRPDL